jgi:peptidoglycan hydrolase-like protein with peptidoglycan-binding domain
MDYGKIISMIIGLLSGTGAASSVVKALLSAFAAIFKDLNVPAATMDVTWAQRALTKLGFDPGPVDGVLGSKTTVAIKAYQAARGLVVDGWLGGTTQTQLRVEAGDG